MTRTNDTRHRRLRNSTVRIAVSLVVILSAIDTHGATLNHATFKTPTPVLKDCELGSQVDHVEPGNAVLPTAHEAALLKSGKSHVLILLLNRSLMPRLASAYAIPARQEDLPRQLLRQPSPARAPPVA